MNTGKVSSAVPWALLLDAAAVVTNIFLAGYLSREMGAAVRAAWIEDDSEAGRLLGLALLATFVAQMAGAALKAAPMGARLAAQKAGAGAARRRKARRRPRPEGAPPRRSRIFGVLLFLHFVLSTLVVFSIPVLLGLSFGGRLVLLVIPFMFIPTALVWHALDSSGPGPAPGAPPARPLRETAANFCLFSYALINQLFWGGLVVSNSLPGTAGELPERTLQAFLFLVPVTLMYFFSPRILFLADEMEDSRTRLSMTIAVASIAFRWVVGVEAAPGP